MKKGGKTHKSRKDDPFYVPPLEPKRRARLDAFTQRCILDSFGIGKFLKLPGPLVYKEAPYVPGDAVWDMVNDMRRELHRMVQRGGIPTQEWFRSALFLGTVSLKKGSEAYDEVIKAVWAYTAALADSLERLANAAIEHVPETLRFTGRLALVKEIRGAMEAQARLLKEMKGKKVEFSKGEPAIEWGRILVKAVHGTDPREPGNGFAALSRKLAEIGPGAIPDTDWDIAVMLAKGILGYELKRKARMAVNSPERRVKGGFDEEASKCDGGEEKRL